MRSFLQNLLFLSLIFSSGKALAQPYGWIPKANFEGGARHRAVAITLGNRGYMGLGHINAVTDILYDDWWEYDPGTNSWTQMATYPGGQRMHCSAFAIGMKGYVACGRDQNVVTHNDLFEYDPIQNVWTPKASIPGSIRRGAVAFTIGNKGYVGTGFDGSNYLRDFWEYDPSLDVWNQKLSFPGNKRTSAAGFAIGGKGYLGTGDNGVPHDDFYEFDPVANTWIQKANVPPVPRMEACAFTLNGYGYIGTGADQQSGNSFSDFWRYDPASDSWTQVQDFSGAARRYMSTFTIGTRAYAGLGTSGINYNDLWEFGTLSSTNDLSTAHNTSVSVYPNPMIDRTTISIQTNSSMSFKNISLSVYDLAGKQVKFISDQNSLTINLNRSNLMSGTYIYKVQDAAAGLIGSGKLIIE